MGHGHDAGVGRRENDLSGAAPDLVDLGRRFGEPGVGDDDVARIDPGTGDPRRFERGGHQSRTPEFAVTHHVIRFERSPGTAGADQEPLPECQNVVLDPTDHRGGERQFGGHGPVTLQDGGKTRLDRGPGMFEIEQRVGHAGQRRDYDDRPFLAARGDDAHQALDGGGIGNRGAAELGDDHRATIPSLTSSSAF